MAVGCVLFPALCWRQLTSSLVFTLTGRRWISDSAIYIYAMVLLGLGSGAAYIAWQPEQLERVQSALPWAISGLAAVKVGVAGQAIRLGLRRRLLEWSSILKVLAIWLVLTACGVAMAVLADPAQGRSLFTAVGCTRRRGIRTSVPLLHGSARARLEPAPMSSSQTENSSHALTFARKTATSTRADPGGDRSPHGSPCRIPHSRLGS